MTSVTTDSLLKGIGCNMLAKAPKTLFPEECLVELSKSVLTDPKALVLVTGAIERNAGSSKKSGGIRNTLKKSQNTQIQVIAGGNV